jgi:hypothetical protein
VNHAAARPAPLPTPDEVIPNGGEAPAASPAETAAPPAPSPAPIAPARRRGIAALVGTGLIGGLAGAGLVVAADAWRRYQPSPLERRIAEVEQRVAATATREAIAAAERRLAALEIDSRAFVERLRATQAIAERGAEQARQALERPAAAASAAVPGAAGSDAAVADLATRLAALEARVQERLQGTANAAQAIERQLEERLQGITNATHALERQVQERVQSVGNATQALERRLADQDQRLAALARQLSERGPDAMAASLRVVVAERLDGALRDGEALGGLIAMLRRLDVKPEHLAALEPYASTGARTAAALAEEFKPLGSRIVAEARAPAGDWGDRVWRMLDKVVTVRAVGEPQGSDPASLVARIDRALADDALAEAAAAWDALPESARRASQGWGEKLKQRAAAEAAAQRISTEALSALEAATR